MTLNLYMVLDANYDWCCFAFDTSRNRAKLRVAQEFGCEYIDMRCKTLKKGVNVLTPMLVTNPEDKGYDIVQNFGYSYENSDDELCLDDDELEQLLADIESEGL